MGSPWYSYREDLGKVGMALDRGCRLFRLCLSKNAWDADASVGGVTYRQHCRDVVDLIRGRGGYIVTNEHCYAEWTGAASYKELGLLFTQPALQTSWINTWKAAISALNPDWHEFVNEPTEAALSGTSLTNAQLLVKYRAFMDTAIPSYRSIIPSLPIYVMGQPFWDPIPLLNNIEASPPPYRIDGLSIHNYSIASNATQDIEDAYKAGNPSLARQLIEARLITKNDVPRAQGMGLDVYFSEVGTIYMRRDGSGLPNTYWSPWMQVTYDILNAHGCSWSQHSLIPNTSAVAFGMIKASTYTHEADVGIPVGELNAIGRLWADNLSEIISDPVALISTPILVTFTVDGGQYPSGTTLMVPRGSVIDVSLPETVTA